MKIGIHNGNIWRSRLVLPATLLLVLANTASLLPVLPAYPASAAFPAQAKPVDFAAMDDFIRQEMKAIHIPGLAIAVVQDDQIVHTAGFGSADPSGREVTPQTPFHIASLSKSFTALAVMQLVEQGKIDVEAPVQRYLPWFQVASSEDSARITVLDLLKHTSGIPQQAGNDYKAVSETDPQALEARVRALNSIPLHRPPDSGYEYSNANYDVLGMIIQEVSRESYDEYIQKHVFTPLDMQHSFSDPALARQDGLATGYRQWFGIPDAYPTPQLAARRPSGFLTASAEDAAHFLIAVLHEGRYQDESLLSPNGIKQFLSVDESTHGMTWGKKQRVGIPVLEASGDDAHFAARAYINPEEKWGIVILMNTNTMIINGNRTEAFRDGIIRLYRGEQPVPAAQATDPFRLGGMIAVPVITVLLALNGFRVLRKINRRQREGTGHIQEPTNKQLWKLGGLLVVDLLWIALLLLLMPFPVWALSDQPLLFLLRTIPDYGWLLVISAALTTGAGLLRSLLAYRWFHVRTGKLVGQA